MYEFRRLTNYKEIEIFHTNFTNKIGYEIPLRYFLIGDCYGIVKKGKSGMTIPSGFCLVHDIPSKLRSLMQIPEGQARYRLPLAKTAEFTGYYLNDKSTGFYFTINLVKTILTHKARFFVYSYPVSQKRLGAYYAHGDPVRLYSGTPKKLPGHKDDMEHEHVEALTKWGIVKIFMARTLRYFIK